MTVIHPDPHATGREGNWGLATEWFERRKLALTLAALPRGRFRRGLDLGSGPCSLLADLAGCCESLWTTGYPESTVGTVLRQMDGRENVAVLPGELPASWPQGTFDLIAMVDGGNFLDAESLDRVITSTRSALEPGGLVLLCHWREPIDGWPLDGDTIHARFLAKSGLDVLVEHFETEFVLHVLTRPQQYV